MCVCPFCFSSDFYDCVSDYGMSDFECPDCGERFNGLGYITEEENLILQRHKKLKDLK